MNKWKLLQDFDFGTPTGEIVEGKVNDIIIQKEDTFTLNGIIITANHFLFFKQTDKFEHEEVYEVLSLNTDQVNKKITLEFNTLPEFDETKLIKALSEFFNRF